MLQEQRHSQRPGGKTAAAGTGRRTSVPQSYYENAKRLVSQALSADEGGDRMEALELYNRALSALSLGLGIPRQAGRGGAGEEEEARGKMTKMKEQVKTRMEVLLDQETEARRSSTSRTAPQHAGGPPSTADSRRNGEAAPRGVQRGSLLGGAPGRRKDSSSVRVKADLMFHTDTGVGLFQVDRHDHVRQFADVESLSIFCYHRKIEGQPPAFLQCGGFVYPLVPGKSPVLKGSGGVYVFPDLRGTDGMSVGVVLDSASESQIRELDRILAALADLRTAGEDSEGKGAETAEETEKPNWGTVVAEKIDKGVTWVSTKISKGTEAASSYIAKGGTKAREKIEPNEKPAEISESVQKGVRISRKVSGVVVVVSEFLMLSLARVTVKVGKEVAKAVSESEAVKGKEVHPQAKEAWKVTKSSFKGVATVFGDLERSAVVLLKAVGRETSKTVEHKYGEEAGKVADDSLHTAGNVALLAHTYWSWKTWGIHFLGKIGDVLREEGEQEEGKTEEEGGTKGEKKEGGEKGETKAGGEKMTRGSERTSKH